MDAKVLNMCLEENLFKNPKSKKGKASKPKAIPSNNPYKYRDYVEHIVEMAKVQKNEVVTLHVGTHIR